MPATDEISDLLRLDADQLHETAKKGLWVSLFTGIFGLVLTRLSLLILVTTALSIGGDESALLSWVASKSIMLTATVILIVPLVRGLRWISERLNRSSTYAWAFLDPIFALLWIAIGIVGVEIAASSLEAQPNIDSPLGLVFIWGIYFVFAGVGTASAMAWLFAGTTIVVYFKHLQVSSIIYKFTNAIDLFWSLIYYPKLWYWYAEINHTTLSGAALKLLRQAGSEIKAELERAQSIKNEKRSETKSDDSSEPIGES
ncbi:hypothetical protein [Natrinema salsiterrestre]|uniref:Uncharacterized protein n=1 Tax=Natrinema salsiterrestre TaxID=2950540 RepID=A0A9Q4PZA5_9EURY|nr:hypothetical protein [Natrinema salsiterrestre]MDF9744525.1 hypothetical protein [Natrinema salsiterrestre]